MLGNSIKIMAADRTGGEVDEQPSVRVKWRIRGQVTSFPA
jgi:hypothetical protein